MLGVRPRSPCGLALPTELSLWLTAFFLSHRSYILPVLSENICGVTGFIWSSPNLAQYGVFQTENWGLEVIFRTPQPTREEHVSFLGSHGILARIDRAHINQWERMHIKVWALTTVD